MVCRVEADEVMRIGFPAGPLAMVNSKLTDRVGVASGVRIAAGAPARVLSWMPLARRVQLASWAAVGVAMADGEDDV